VKIIGIHNTGTTSSCAIVENGELIFAVAEERISRLKYDNSFPILGIKECLKYSNLDFKDIDIFAIGWNPAKNIASRTRPGFSKWVPYPGFRFSSNPNNLLPNFDRDIKEYDYTLQEFNFKKNKKLKIIYVNHHNAHLAHAFFSSGFKKSDLISIDGYGEASSFVWGKGDSKRISIDIEQEYPHSIGEFFSTLTSFLGYEAYKDEWKVMGMSAFGKYKKYYSKIKKLIKLDKKNIFLTNLNYFNYFNYDSKNRFSNSLVELLGEPRQRNAKIDQKHFDIAAAAQKVLEDLVLNLIIKLSKKSKNKNLCLSGGVAMNSVLNQKIHGLKLYKNIYIPYSPDDQGNSIGAALWASSKFDKKNKFSFKQLQTPYTGREFSNFEIEKELKIFKVKYNKITDVTKIGAKLIADGKIIAWFQGKEEFGQRALGNRSILADPREILMKDKINLAVKFRESYRPFAPAIIDDYKNSYFLNGKNINSNYMERTEKFLKNIVDKIPSVVHKDLTGRLQTVKKEHNKLFYELINEFRKLTSIPLILNTSFNLNNEPVVSSPKDAIRTFFTSGLDALIIGNFIVIK
jgi:carbamoyltransferase